MYVSVQRKHNRHHQGGKIALFDTSVMLLQKEKKKRQLGEIMICSCSGQCNKKRQSGVLWPVITLQRARTVLMTE